MKTLPVLLTASLLLLAGCAGNAGSASPGRSPNSPPGTALGGSNPAVNQPTTTTETGRANNVSDDIPNSHR